MHERLRSELRRLNFVAGETADDAVRALRIDFPRAADWPAVAALLDRLCGELDLPVPAVSVGGEGGYSLWLALAEAQPLAAATDFLAAVQPWLSELPAERYRLRALQGADAMPEVPARQANGRWSAFIDPGMGSMFVDEPGLEIAPNMARQADMLAALRPIASADFRRIAGGRVELPATPVAAPLAQVDPRTFLMAVMNDPAVAIGDRIRAAQVLLTAPPA